MLIKKLDKSSGKVLVTSKPLLVSAKDAYARPAETGRDWWLTTTTVWPADELIRTRVRDWRRLLGETGHTGERTQTMRKDHDSVYTGTHSVFPAPLVEWILLRYGGVQGGHILDAFAGGPPRAVVAALMGFNYLGVDIRQEQIDENIEALAALGLSAAYVCGDGRYLTDVVGPFDAALTCPPYYNLEVYSDRSDDLSNLSSYEEFDAGMAACAKAHRRLMKPGAFVCIVVGPFRDKKTGELIDFPGHTIVNFRKAGFIFWQQIIISKNFSSAAQRASTSWRNFKLVPRHEFLLVFRTPGGEEVRNEPKSKRHKAFLGESSR